MTLDGYVVNHTGSYIAYSVNSSSSVNAKLDQLVPNQTALIIGDRLSAAGVSWAWYAGGWNEALAGRLHERFQFHHQPFVYFVNYADGTARKAKHLKDETMLSPNTADGTRRGRVL